jgi:hypothetical protein
MSTADCQMCGHRRGNHEDDGGPCTVRFGRPSLMNVCTCTAFRAAGVGTKDGDDDE